MGAITTADGFLARVAGFSQAREFWRTNAFTIATGNQYSMWLGTGTPGPGVAPGGAAAVPTSATAGALAKFTNAGGGEWLHLIAADANFGTSVAELEMWDRLIHSGGLDGRSVLSQAVNTPAINRGDANGVGVEWFLECYADLGTVGATATITYTNESSVGSRTTTVAVPASWRAGRVLQITNLQAGDRFIKSIESVQLSADTLTTGNFGVTAGRRIHPICCMFPNVIEEQTLFDTCLPRVENNACLWLTALATTGTIGTCNGGFRLITTG
jgi:hypothetical protein